MFKIPLLPHASLLLVILAATADDAPLERIEVKAQKRLQPIQEVPVAMTVLSGEQLQQLALGSADQVVDASPNANATRAASGMVNYFIRDVGMDDFNLSSVGAVGIYLDDVAINSHGHPFRWAPSAGTAWDGRALIRESTLPGLTPCATSCNKTAGPPPGPGSAKPLTSGAPSSV